MSGLTDSCAAQETGTAGFDFIVTPLRNGDASALVRDGTSGSFPGLQAADALFVDSDHSNQVAAASSALPVQAAPAHAKPLLVRSLGRSATWRSQTLPTPARGRPARLR